MVDSESGSQIDAREAELEIEERKLRIKGLKRPFWMTPAILVPFIVALIGLAAGQLSGWFELQVDKQKLSSDQAKLAEDRAKWERDKLVLESKRIDSEINQLKLSLAKQKSLFQLAQEPHLEIEINTILEKYEINLTNKWIGNVAIKDIDIFVDGNFLNTQKPHSAGRLS